MAHNKFLYPHFQKTDYFPHRVVGLYSLLALAGAFAIECLSCLDVTRVDGRTDACRDESLFSKGDCTLVKMIVARFNDDISSKSISPSVVAASESFSQVVSGSCLLLKSPYV